MTESGHGFIVTNGELFVTIMHHLPAV